MFPTKTLYAFLFAFIRATCSAHLNLLDLMIRIILHLVRVLACYSVRVLVVQCYSALNQESNTTDITQPVRAGCTEQFT